MKNKYYFYLSLLFIIIALIMYFISQNNNNSFNEIKQANKIPVRIDINKASIDEFTLLPGIGESLAKRIIQYRNKNGAFEKIEDIMNIKGIKKNKFEKIKEFIYVE